MEERTLRGFQETMEKEMESTIKLILQTKWNENNYKTLSELTRLVERYQTTLNYIKQYRRGLI